MTRKEVAELVAQIGLPYAYYQFPDDTPQSPPFVCYFYGSSDDVFADSENYAKIRVLNIELYTKDKEFELEDIVEGILRENHLSYYKEENYIDSEKMYQIAYEMEVLING